MFPKNSAFGQQADAEKNYRYARPDVPGPVRHVGQPNIVEIPLNVLEGWIHELEGLDKPSEDDGPMLERVADQMRSYFRG
jgi:hypothetical protein